MGYTRPCLGYGSQALLPHLYPRGNSQVGNAMTRAFSFLLLALSYQGLHTHLVHAQRNKEGSLKKCAIATQARGRQGQSGSKGGNNHALGRAGLGLSLTRWRALEAWKSSTPLCASVFSFFLKGRGRSCGRKMNEIPSSSKMLQLHAIHHGEERLLIETPLRLSGDLCILWLLLPFPGSRRAQSTDLII